MAKLRYKDGDEWKSIAPSQKEFDDLKDRVALDKLDYVEEIGTVANLTTTSKEVVGAVNELNTNKANKVQEEWITPTLINGWENVSGELTRYMKDEFGFVTLQVSVKSGIQTQLLTLPSGYRPQATYFQLGAESTTLRIFYVNPGGTLIVVGLLPNENSSVRVTFRYKAGA